ncbi:hypothetical protein DITRI_Ditri10aG0055800 [Diplodiscus trichospermus]
MNQSKVHSQGTVPFSWENKPGVCKLANQEGPKEDCFLQKLPPPPCPPAKAPCAFHQPSRTSSRRGLKKSDDPFLAAFKECSKSKSNSKGKLARKDGGSGLKMGLFNFSCKQSCSFRNDNLVRVSQLHLLRETDQVSRCEK